MSIVVAQALSRLPDRGYRRHSQPARCQEVMDRRPARSRRPRRIGDTAASTYDCNICIIFALHENWAQLLVEYTPGCFEEAPV